MKLTPRNLDAICKIIDGMRGKITRDRIHQRVGEKVVDISARALFAHPLVKTAYKNKRKEAKAKKEAKPAQEAPLNATEIIAVQQHKIAHLEEEITILFANAAAQGVNPEKLKRPMRPLEFGNTYPRSST